jgi:ATP-binding cassette, subfamily B, multidrug efflux pump
MLKLFRYLKRYSFEVVAILVLVFLQTQADLYLPTLMSGVINDGVMKGDTSLIWSTGGLMLLVAAGGVVCAILASFLSSRAAMGFGAILRERVFTRVENFSLDEFDKFGSSTLITRSTNDVTQVSNVTMMIMRMMLSAPMMAIGGIILALRQDVELSYVLMIAIPILLVVIVVVAGIGLPLFRAIQGKIDKINLVLRENLTGMRVIRAFNQEAREEGRFEEANQDLTSVFIKVNRIMAFLMPTIMIIMNLTSLAILWFGMIRIDSGAMSMGALIAFTQYAMQILFSFLMFSMMFIMVPRAQAAAKRINEVLATEPEIKDSANPQVPARREGEVVFDDVCFSYHGAEQPAVEHISFTAKAGEVTAIIGSTGSGKSTLVKLIPRFYDSDCGGVFVDGVDVKQMSQKELRDRIGYVPQKAVLFSGTIADNIRFGAEDASDEDVRRVAEIAQASGFVEEMEGAYGHEIAQGGTNVSGGQKQRLSIARALARKPEIYIFDDTFSALDFKTDAKLRAALRSEIKEATLIIVAQRVGTVMDADQILVMDEGRIVGRGRHDELLKTCEVYKEIVSSQLEEGAIA